MKNKIKFVVVFFGIVLFAGIVSAQSSCYTQLQIKETLDTESGNIYFSLIGLQGIYGDYEDMVNYYSYPIYDYALKTYSSNRGFMNKYGMYTTLLTYYDDFGDSESPGGVIQNNESVNTVYIPYDENISYLEINNSGKITELDFDSEQVGCVADCKKEGEIGNWEDDECCDGLKASDRFNGSFVCVNCGNRDCGYYETYYSCSEDCSIGKIDRGNRCGNSVCEENENYDSCPEDCEQIQVSLQDVLNIINQWANNQATLQDVLNTINQWAS